MRPRSNGNSSSKRQIKMHEIVDSDRVGRSLRVAEPWRGWGDGLGLGVLRSSARGLSRNRASWGLTVSMPCNKSTGVSPPSAQDFKLISFTVRRSRSISCPPPSPGRITPTAGPLALPSSPLEPEQSPGQRGRAAPECRCPNQSLVSRAASPIHSGASCNSRKEVILCLSINRGYRRRDQDPRLGGRPRAR